MAFWMAIANRKPTSCLVGASLIVGLWTLGSPAALAVTLKDVKRHQAQQTGTATWTAEPSVRAQSPQASGIPSVEFRAGALEEETDSANAFRMAESERSDTTQITPTPASFDWRQVNGVSYIPAVPAQGECGACVSFAAAGTLEIQLAIACNAPGQPFSLSKQYLHSCGGGTCRGGWMLSKAVDFLTESGTPDEPCMPYLGQDGTCSQACGDADRRSVRLYSHEQITSGFIDVARIKAALMKGPLLSSMVLYEDLEFYRSGVYRYTTGAKLGSHAVIIVGWSDADKAWIVRNSWGPNWGDGGFFKAAWDDPAVLTGRYTWLFNVSNAVREGICARPR